MRVLRVFKQILKPTLYATIAFGVATILTISSSRPAAAEGYLLDTVRCLVRTVLLTQCPPGQQVPAVTPTAPAAPSEAPAQEAAPTTAQAQPRAATTTQPVSQAGSVGAVGGLDVPIASLASYKPASPTAGVAQYPTSRGADYLAMFNTSSRYAVLGAENQAATGFERTGEGWKIAGIAWYWWGIGLLVAAIGFVSVKKLKLSKI